MTSIVRQFARTLGIECIVRVLSGAMDAADVIGIKDTDKATKTTVHYLPEWWPKPGTCGVLVFDDVTRCERHIFNLIMQLANEGAVNEAILPEGWTILFTANPEDGHDVITLDDAQQTRMLHLVYNRPVDIFHEQLVLQDGHPDLQTLYHRNPELCEAPVCTVDPPENNDRFRMIFARIYPYLINDEEALHVAGGSMFGPQFTQKLILSRQEEQPFNPEDVLNNWAGISPLAAEYKSRGRTDILGISTHRLVHYMNTKNPEVFTKSQFTNLAEFGQMLPESEAGLLTMKLFGRHAPSGVEFSKQMARSTRQENGSNHPFGDRMARIMAEASAD